MGFWFEKGDLRRFRRMTLSVKAFVTPEFPIKDREILTFDIDYFPPVVRKRIEQKKAELVVWMHRIQDQREVLEPVILEILKGIEVFGLCVKNISSGRNPLNNAALRLQLKRYSKGVGSVSFLQQSAPKTHQYLQEVNVKLVAFFTHLGEVMQHSSAQKFHTLPLPPLPFPLDTMIERFRTEQFDEVPLVQTIVHLADVLGEYLFIYQSLCQDYLCRKHPKYWPKIKLNLSAGGLAIKAAKHFKLGTRLKVYLMLGVENRLLTLSAYLVRYAETEDGWELNCVNFEFPEPQDQRFLQQVLLREEIDHCLPLLVEGA